jgi:hypothetical protein
MVAGDLLPLLARVESVWLAFLPLAAGDGAADSLPPGCAPSPGTATGVAAASGDTDAGATLRAGEAVEGDLVCLGIEVIVIFFQKKTPRARINLGCFFEKKRSPGNAGNPNKHGTRSFFHLALSFSSCLGRDHQVEITQSSGGTPGNSLFTLRCSIWYVQWCLRLL